MDNFRRLCDFGIFLLVLWRKNARINMRHSFTHSFTDCLLPIAWMIYSQFEWFIHNIRMIHIIILNTYNVHLFPKTKKTFSWWVHSTSWLNENERLKLETSIPSWIAHRNCKADECFLTRSFVCMWWVCGWFYMSFCLITNPFHANNKCWTLQKGRKCAIWTGDCIKKCRCQLHIGISWKKNI